jgi:adenosine deaminase
MSGTNLSHEFQECAQAFGWGLAEFQEITICAMNSAFIDDKSSYLKRIGDSYAQLQ